MIQKAKGHDKLEARLGYKFADPDLLARALTHSSAISPARRIAQSYQRLEFLGDRVLGKRNDVVPEEPPIAGLSPREREVTELLTLGYTNPEIAMALGSSVFTVRNQVRSIFRKAGASTRAELVGIVKQRTLGAD